MKVNNDIEKYLVFERNCELGRVPNMNTYSFFKHDGYFYKFQSQEFGQSSEEIERFAKERELD